MGEGSSFDEKARGIVALFGRCHKWRADCLQQGDKDPGKNDKTSRVSIVTPKQSCTQL